MRSLTSWSSWPTAARSSRRPIEPEPLPDLILSRSNVTAVETLPAGALLGCRLITAAVTFHKPPGARNEKLVGADSTANGKGGMCMERVAAGKYSVWVQAVGHQDGAAAGARSGNPGLRHVRADRYGARR